MPAKSSLHGGARASERASSHSQFFVIGQRNATENGFEEGKGVLLSEGIVK